MSYRTSNTKKKQTFFWTSVILDLCQISEFGLFIFFWGKILCQTTGVFPSKVAFTEGKSRWNSSVQGAPFPSRSTEAVGDQPQSETNVGVGRTLPAEMQPRWWWKMVRPWTDETKCSTSLRGKRTRLGGPSECVFFFVCVCLYFRWFIPTKCKWMNRYWIEKIYIFLNMNKSSKNVIQNQQNRSSILFQRKLVIILFTWKISGAFLGVCTIFCPCPTGHRASDRCSSGATSESLR